MTHHAEISQKQSKEVGGNVFDDVFFVIDKCRKLTDAQKEEILGKLKHFQNDTPKSVANNHADFSEEQNRVLSVEKRSIQQLWQEVYSLLQGIEAISGYHPDVVSNLAREASTKSKELNSLIVDGSWEVKCQGDHQQEKAQAEKAQKPENALSYTTYCNPNFVPRNHIDDKEEYVRVRASTLACDLWSIVSTAENVFESESTVPIEDRGISGTLEVARHMANDLIEVCTNLEWDLKQAKVRSNLQ